MGVIDSWLDVGVCGVGSSEGEVEVASWVLWSDGAADGEVVTLHHLQPLLLALRNPLNGVYEGDVWLKQHICNKTEVIGSKNRFIRTLETKYVIVEVIVLPEHITSSLAVELADTLVPHSFSEASDPTQDNEIHQTSSCVETEVHSVETAEPQSNCLHTTDDDCRFQ